MFYFVVFSFHWALLSYFQQMTPTDTINRQCVPPPSTITHPYIICNERQTLGEKRPVIPDSHTKTLYFLEMSSEQHHVAYRIISPSRCERGLTNSLHDFTHLCIAVRNLYEQK